MGGAAKAVGGALGNVASGVTGAFSPGGALEQAGGFLNKGIQGIGEGLTSGFKKVGLAPYKAGEIPLEEEAFKDTSRSQAQIAELEKQREALSGRKATQVAAAQLPEASQMTPAELAKAEQINAAQLGTSQEDWRQQQMALAEALQQQATGQGPSLAQSQLEQARQDQIRTAMALAASQRGLTAGQGLRSIADQAAQAQQFAASEAARQRIAEQLMARQQQAGLLQGARGIDVNVAGQQAGLEQQAALANQAALNQAAQLQAGLEQQAALTNVGALNEAALAQAGLTQQAALANQAADLQMAGLSDQFVNALNQQIAGLSAGEQQRLMDLQKLKFGGRLEQQAMEAAQYGKFGERAGELIGKIGEGIASYGGAGAGAPPTPG